MHSILKILLAMGLLAMSVESRRPSLIWNFEKEITVHKKVILAATPMLTENESFMYIICDDSRSLGTFIESQCNVTVEKPVLPSVTLKRSCPIHIKPDTFEGHENLKHLSLSSVGEDKAILTWVQISRGRSLAKLKLVKMGNCEVIDVPIPVEEIRFVVPYGTGLDLVMYSTYCGSPICKQTLNADGQIVSEPTNILFRKNHSLHDYAPLGPVAAGSVDKGFYMKNRFTGDRSRLYRVSANGTGDEVTTFSTSKPYGYSTTYGLLSLCDSFTNMIACRTFDSNLEWKMDRTVEFQDKGLIRWLQPYNLQDGAVLLITGRASDEKAQRFDHFSVYRLDANGQKHRKRLEIENLNFHCQSTNALRVHVSESQVGKFCFYFSCVHRESEKHKYQFAFKCYPKSYFDAFVPLTNGCFLASGDEAITDFTIYA